MANDVLLMVLMVTIFAIIIVSILVGIIFKQRMDAEKKAKGSGASNIPEWVSHSAVMAGHQGPNRGCLSITNSVFFKITA